MTTEAKKTTLNRKPTTGAKAKTDKQQAVAFFNWEATTKNGDAHKCKNGFAIFDNEFLDPQLKPLMAAAMRDGGEYTTTMTVTIRMAKPAVERTAEDF